MQLNEDFSNVKYNNTKTKNLDASVFLSHRLALKLETKTTKPKQYSKQTRFQIIVLLNITTNTSIKNNGKQVNKNTPTTL